MPLAQVEKVDTVVQVEAVAAPADMEGVNMAAAIPEAVNMEAVVPIPAVIPAAPDGQVGVPIAEGEAIVSEPAMVAPLD